MTEFCVTWVVYPEKKTYKTGRAADLDQRPILVVGSTRSFVYIFLFMRKSS